MGQIFNAPRIWEDVNRIDKHPLEIIYRRVNREKTKIEVEKDLFIIEHSLDTSDKKILSQSDEYHLKNDEAEVWIARRLLELQF